MLRGPEHDKWIIAARCADAGAPFVDDRRASRDYGLQRASWDEVGAVIWVANRGKNIVF